MISDLNCIPNILSGLSKEWFKMFCLLKESEKLFQFWNLWLPAYTGMTLLGISQKILSKREFKKQKLY